MTRTYETLGKAITPRNIEHAVYSPQLEYAIFSSAENKSPAFIITSCPRSGTLYITRLLQALDIPTRHESVYGIKPQSADPSIGEVSWAAAAFLNTLPDTAPIIHLTRSPQDTISSAVAVWSRVPDNDATRLHTKVVDQFCPGLPHTDRVRRETAFYFKWHALIQDSATNKNYLRYRIEDIDTALPQILHFLSIKRTEDQIQRALATVPKNTNTIGEVYRLPLRFTEDQRRQAQRLGYQV